MCTLAAVCNCKPLRLVSRSVLSGSSCAFHHLDSVSICHCRFIGFVTGRPDLFYISELVAGGLEVPALAKALVLEIPPTLLTRAHSSSRSRVRPSRKINSLFSVLRERLASLPGLPSARPHPPCKDGGMLLESDYIQPPKPLPPIPVRVSRRSQLTAALRQHARPIVIEDQGLARPFARLLRARGNYDCGRLVNSSRIRCRMRLAGPMELTSRRIGTSADMFCRGTCKR